VRRAVTIIGIGEDGCAGLSSRAVNAVAAAQVLVGGERHLAFFPQFGGQRIVVKSALETVLDRIAQLAEDHSVCVLASGDPLFFGFGAQVASRLGAEHVEVIAHPSSVQLAFARVGVRWDDAVCISVHGKSLDGFVARLTRAHKVFVLTDPESTPSRLATRMIEHGETAWDAWVCENLGGPAERVRRVALADLAQLHDFSRLNVLVLMRSDPAWRPPPAIPFLHEDAFAKRVPKKGLITKREVRVLSLAALEIRPDAVVWDVGAGSGSVAIEAAKLAPLGRVYAIEIDPEGVDICRENVRVHGTDNVRIVSGLAPDALADLEAPDAVFVGGSKGNLEEILALALDRLTLGGRLVVNAITLDNVTEAYRAFRARALVPEVMLLNVARGEPLAHYLRYEALNPIHIFAVTKVGVAS
jgi:precorrin-6Y C5,15-methyltransferase (decarboxylating)